MSDTKDAFNEDELCDIFNEKNQVTSNISNKKLFLKLSGFDEKKPDDFKIVSIDQFTGEFSRLILGNGGSWCRMSAWSSHKVATMKKNGNINYLWDALDEEKKSIENAFSNFPKDKGSNIQYIGIFGLLNKKTTRPIRNDIKRYWINFSCCACGRNTDLICDHKNDLYNDPRVLQTKTQTKEDFQSLCNQCNLLKRQVSKNTKKTKKRYGATNIQMLKVFGIDFIHGNETYDPDNVDAMKGTYWYDPIAFMGGVYEKMKNKYYNLGVKSQKEIKPKSSGKSSNDESSNDESSNDESSNDESLSNEFSSLSKK